MAPKRGLKKERNDGRGVDLSSLSFLAWFASFVKQIAEHSSPPPDVNRFESYCEISVTSFRYICSLVVEHMSKSPEYKTDDENKTVLPFYTEVAIAIRWLKSGQSLNSIGQNFKVHSFTTKKVTDSFMEALAENGLRHLQGTATEEEMDPGALARLTEEWKVLSTPELKPDKRPSTILACTILHNIVHDGNV